MVTADVPVLFSLVADQLAATSGVITPDVKTALDALPLGVTTADAIIDEIQAAEKAETEAKAAAAPFVRQAAPHLAKAKLAAAKIESLKTYLHERMEAAKVLHLISDRHECRVQNNAAPKIRWIGPGELPEAFRKPIIELDPAKAKVAYDAKNLPAGFDAKVGTQLRIVY